MSYRNIIYLKRKLSPIVICIWNKIRDFCIDKIEKSQFCDFRSQKVAICWQSWLNFWKTCQDIKKLLYQLLVGMFMDKVKNFCDHSIILWEMAGNLHGPFWVSILVLKLNQNSCFSHSLLSQPDPGLKSESSKWVNFIEKSDRRLGSTYVFFLSSHNLQPIEAPVKMSKKFKKILKRLSCKSCSKYSIPLLHDINKTLFRFRNPTRDGWIK